jgi:hypothetical protein
LHQADRRLPLRRPQLRHRAHRQPAPSNRLPHRRPRLPQRRVQLRRPLHRRPVEARVRHRRAPDRLRLPLRHRMPRRLRRPPLPHPVAPAARPRCRPARRSHGVRRQQSPRRFRPHHRLPKPLRRLHRARRHRGRGASTTSAVRDAKPRKAAAR